MVDRSTRKRKAKTNASIARFPFEVLQGRHFVDVASCQERFDAWRAIYNHERPHEALGMKVPASRYQPSARSYPERLPPLEYHATDIVRVVQKDACIYFHSRPWKVGKAFIGQRLAVRPQLDDGKYQILFGTIDIAQLDLHQQNT